MEAAPPGPLPRPHARLHPLQQQLQAVDGRAVGGREVVSELAQQPQPKLREGGEAVGQALFLGGQGPSELIDQPPGLPWAGRPGAGGVARVGQGGRRTHPQAAVCGNVLIRGFLDTVVNLLPTIPY